MFQKFPVEEKLAPNPGAPILQNHKLEKLNGEQVKKTMT